MEKKTASSISSAGKTGQPHMGKNEIRTLPNTIHKNKLQMDERPRYKPDTVKLLEENIGQTFSDINNSNIFSDPPLRVMTVKTKINKWDLKSRVLTIKTKRNKWDLIKLQSFCTAKETLNNTKRQPTEWEKIFANESTDKGFISKTDQHLRQLHTKKTNNPIKKWAGDRKTILQRRHTYGQKTHEKMFNITHL